ncbi:putative Transcription factor domain-containing protein [Seiridium unicorne]|uniref:Transcription factor domain-containing protein n=1 Tax=Seiridium unicorne TaxID=138068 RepID=A0ABR2UXV1_9PEZI
MAAANQASAAQTPRAVFLPRTPQRACARCARSKQRCVWSADSESPGSFESASCDRCAKSNLECTPCEARPRKKRGKSTCFVNVPISRVRELEQKVDGIMSLLASNQHTRLPVADSLQGISTPSSAVSAISCAHNVIRTNTPSDSCNIGAAPTTETINLAHGYNITASEAEDVLSTYREKLTPLFPFVPLPSESALQMHHRTPLLFHAIVMVVTSGDVELQQKLKQDFREKIATKIIVHAEKSLELLQAILVYLACSARSDFHFYMCAQGTDFVQLAISLVMDLGLGKPPSQSWGTIPRLFVDDAGYLLKGSRMKELHGLEDMRAMLGCYYMANL